jgi:hypothetical protein
MASIWRNPKSKYFTACFRDGGGRQRRITTKEINRRRALKIAEAFERAARAKRPKMIKNNSIPILIQYTQPEESKLSVPRSELDLAGLVAYRLFIMYAIFTRSFRALSTEPVCKIIDSHAICVDCFAPTQYLLKEILL